MTRGARLGGNMPFCCMLLAVVLTVADSIAQQEQRTLQHRMAPMYRMPESSGTQPQFVARETHDSAGEHYDHRLLELQSHFDGGVQATLGPEADDVTHTVLMAGLEKSCSSSSMCYCCRWTIRRQTTTAMCDVPHYVTVEEPVCVQIIEDHCVQTAIQPRLEERGRASVPCDKRTTQRTCTRCCHSALALSSSPSMQCSAPRMTSPGETTATPVSEDGHTAHRRSVGPYFLPTQGYAIQDDAPAYSRCCLSRSRPACCGSLPGAASSTFREALARCCSTGAASVSSQQAALESGDAVPVRRPAMLCCTEPNPPSCCFSQVASIRAICCEDDRVGRQVGTVEVAPSCCTSASKVSCCSSAAVRPQCCMSIRTRRPVMEAAALVASAEGSFSDDECCSVEISVRASCCRRFSSPAHVRCCQADSQPPQRWSQPATRVEPSDCCTSSASVRDACCRSAAMSSVTEVRCCSRRIQPASFSDCCTSLPSSPRPACCATSASQAARAACCNAALYSVQDTSCCSAATQASLLQCCTTVLYSSSCCSARLVAASTPTTTTTTTTTTTPPPAMTQEAWTMPCCSSSSPAMRDACCTSVSAQRVMLLPCCTQTRAFSSAMMSSCCSSAQAQSQTPCCSSSSQSQPDGSVRTITRCCSSSSSSSSSMSSYQSSSIRDESPSCCGRTGSLRDNCCAVYAFHHQLPRCCSSSSSMTSLLSEVARQDELPCCSRSASEMAQCCASLPIAASSPPCCSSGATSRSSQVARQPQPASCCSGSAFARVQCCSTHALQSPAPSCCSSSLQALSGWDAQQAAPSCCHTPASLRPSCCASTAYSAHCCQSMRRSYK